MKKKEEEKKIALARFFFLRRASEMDRRAAGEMQKRFYFFTKYKTLLYAGTKRRYIDEQSSASFIMTLDSIRDFLGVKILRIISGQRVSRYIYLG